jgi:hypothetical protein
MKNLSRQLAFDAGTIFRTQKSRRMPTRPIRTHADKGKIYSIGIAFRQRRR